MPQRARLGEAHGMARLTARQVADTRLRLGQLPPERRGPEIERRALRYGVSRTALSDAAAGVTWSHLKTPRPIKRQRRQAAA
jgi:hypothetical protein